MKLFFYLILLTIPFICFADHFSIDQQMFFSQLDEKYSKDVEDRDIWALYIRTFGHEKVMVRFPFMPKLTCDRKDHFCIQTKDRHTVYKLFVDPLKHQDPNTVLEKKIEQIQKMRSLRLCSATKKNGEKYAQLELSYIDPWIAGNGEKTVVHLHVIVSNENIYTLLSQGLETEKNEHDTFVNSFEILSTC